MTQEPETKRSDYLIEISHAQAVYLWRKLQGDIYIFDDEDGESLIYSAKELREAIAKDWQLGVEIDNHAIMLALKEWEELKDESDDEEG